MANPEHLDILEQRVEKWNDWRKANPGIQPDLSGAKLRSADLTAANLGLAKLSMADLSLARLSRADLIGAKLSMADLRESNVAT